ncbi:MAG TPA: cupin domain-containing protein [Thermomicrobiales bacterium]|nr:cupin domain-containing protein [Thermomicrobiales bacterium]
MKRFRQDRSSATRNTGEIFIGDVFTQNLVTDDDAPSIRVTAVSFEDGAKNRWHHHTTEQVLIVTHGEGVVESESETYHVSAGDVVLIQAGERHWHGAAEGASMTHLSVLIPGEMAIDDEE